MDIKALLAKALNELLQKDRLLAFALGFVLTAIAAITKLPGEKVHELVCGSPAVVAQPAPAPAAEPAK